MSPTLRFLRLDRFGVLRRAWRPLRAGAGVLGSTIVATIGFLACASDDTQAVTGSDSVLRGGAPVARAGDATAGAQPQSDNGGAGGDFVAAGGGGGHADAAAWGSAGASAGKGGQSGERGGASAPSGVPNSAEGEHAGGARAGHADGGAPDGLPGTGIVPFAGPPAPCAFASGVNLPWVSFARDVPNPNLAAFRAIFRTTREAGGRILRWWYHTNGSVTPGYDASGKALKVAQSHVDGVKAILAAASGAGVGLTVSLWSFDMLQADAGETYRQNQALLENDVNRQAYIDNYLTPLVKAVKGTPGLYSWEIFNEPEGMGPKGWTTHRTTQLAIQKTVNWLAAAIHEADPSALVTNGAQTFDSCSNVAGKSNLYSDDALRAAGGKEQGVLDYYEVHYYASSGSSNSPFTRPASYWKLDKPLVIGEFAAATTDNVGRDALYLKLYDNGYHGAWAWSYQADYPWPAMQVAMQALYAGHPDVGDCP